ncbi:MAG: iron-containing alcohol dehydrogenase, partial [Chloroflexota bacterium]|nr:iron-containing alcohol dehydrogenase [Chloroflexota bacterium]
FNMEADPHRHADVAEAIGVARSGRTDLAIAAEGALLLMDLSERIGIPAFADLEGVNPDDFERLAAASEANGSTPNNARAITADDYLHILQEAYAG